MDICVEAGMKDIIRSLKMNSREEAVSFLKSLWNETPQPCPLCGGSLVFLHKKAKKSSSEWKCRQCGHIYRAINILMELPDH